MKSTKSKSLLTMKHLLIILSILLLSPLLTSCEKKEKTLYKWNTSSGWEWKTTGDKNNNTYYQGEVKREYILFGDYIFDGLGSLTDCDGSKYVGEWKDGEKHGQGTYTSTILNYEGGWKNGKWDGKGTMTFPDGYEYVGEFKDGQFHGQGTNTFPDGGNYVGEWKDGEYHGQGTLTLPDGSKYIGEFKGSLANGQGTSTLSTGTKYEGGMKNGKWDGQGTMTFPDGSMYVGEFKDGEYHGQGIFTHGKGKWKGDKYEGSWEDGKRWNGTEYDKDRNIIGKYVNGKYIEPEEKNIESLVNKDDLSQHEPGAPIEVKCFVTNVNVITVMPPSQLCFKDNKPDGWDEKKVTSITGCWGEVVVGYSLGSLDLGKLRKVEKNALGFRMYDMKTEISFKDGEIYTSVSKFSSMIPGVSVQFQGEKLLRLYNREEPTGVKCEIL